ncbi:MAG: prepilin-type N-terminal cleavage/methylation domain-containing protein [Phycisphaerales bacterium]
MTVRRGFTLIELLVVIAVIALLMSILMPALSAAREQGRRAVCAQNEKNTGLGLTMYANDYNGRLPLNEVDRWLFDVSYWTTDIILKSGGFDRHIFYCPSWRQRDNIIFWRYGENLPAGTPEDYARPEPTSTAERKNAHRIMGYYWLIDCVTPRAKLPMKSTEAKLWCRSVVEAVATVDGVKVKKSLAGVELITDVTASNGPNRDTADFAGATGGCWDRWKVTDRTNHMKKGTHAVGGNILFLDAHVQWRSFDEMELRWPWGATGNPCMWW